MKHFFLVLTSLFLFTPIAQLNAAKDHRILVNKFFATPAITYPSISPDGKFMAYVAPYGDDEKRCLFTLEFATGKVRAFAPEQKQNISHYMWLNDEWIVFNVNVRNIYSLGVFAVKRDDAKSVTTCELATASRILAPYPGNPNQFWVHLINSVAHEDSELVKYDISLISSRKGEYLTTFASKGRAVQRLKDPEGGYVKQWIMRKGEPAITFTFREDKVSYYKIEDQETWKPIPLDPEEWTILGFASQNEVFVVGYDQQETEGLYRYNLDSDSLSKVIYRDPNYDLDNIEVLRLPDSWEPVGFQYEGKKLVNHWFDPTFKEIQTQIDQTFPHSRNRIINTTNDLHYVVFTCSTPTLPHTYYIYDTEKSKIRKISAAYESIKSDDVSPTLRFHFKTKDSLNLEAFFTRPAKGTATTSKPPLVVLIHGGPWVRDTWSYNPEVQFLANLGYAVLQVNYRGSSGYGYQISSEKSLDFEGMVGDVKTATDLAINQGWVDPNRIAVMGGSFGAYSSMFLAAEFPDYFKCAIGTAGVYDLAKQLESYLSQWKHGHDGAYAAYHYWKNHIGDPKLDREHLESISPLFFADQIKCPVFLAHGIHDSTASISQTRSLLKVLKKNSIEIETYFRLNEGHGFRNPENRRDYYEELQAFLAKHL